MKVAVPREQAENERRVALVPDSVTRLVRAGVEVLVESGAGREAYIADEDYAEAGAQVVPEPAALYDQADVTLRVGRLGRNRALDRDEVELLREGSVVIGTLAPLSTPETVRRLAERRITSFSMDAIPRITRAQTMDVLSSQATVAGYKAVLIAADTLGKFFPMLTTAAGTIRPARAFILGAGVAGLQAIATARRLGAEVEAFDVRPVVKEQVQSLGAKFVELEIHEEAQDASGYAKEVSEETHRREQELVHQRARLADVIITTALIPGRPAPRLITEEMVKDMRPGSVIVDLAAEAGGNCEVTVPGEVVVRHGVFIVGLLNLPATIPVHASQMYSRNVLTFLQQIVKGGQLNLNFDDEVVKSTCITHEGQILHQGARARVEALVGAT